jgi:Protein of unknown function (DUF2490)
LPISAGDALRVALLLAAVALPGAAQDARQEFRPELDLYVSWGERVRFLFRDALQLVPQGNSESSFLSAIDFALRPLFRRELRRRDDVFRRRFVTFRAGYQYTTSLNSDTSSENRGIAELTTRYPLGGGIVLVDRNRGDFRFVKGQPFSSRYRNRLWVERDLKVERIVLTPYVYDEIFYDTRYDAWTTNRGAAGVQIAVAAHVVLEPYFMRQRDSRSSPPTVHNLGFKVNLFF